MARQRYYRNSGLPQKVCERIRKGWDEYDALVTPVMRRRKYVR